MTKMFRLAILVVAISIYLGSSCFSQNETYEKEIKSPSKLITSLDQKDHPVLFTGFKGSEGFGFSIEIENPEAWKEVSYGLLISKDAPIGIFVALKPWTIFFDNLYLSTSFGSIAKVKIDMSNLNSTVNTFQDKDNIILFCSLGIVYSVGLFQAGISYRIGQQFPIEKTPRVFMWYQGFQVGVGMRL